MNLRITHHGFHVPRRAQLAASDGVTVTDTKNYTYDANGNLLTQGTAFVRLLVRAVMGFVPLLPMLDLLWPLWDPRNQTLHDKVAGTVVLRQVTGR